MYGADRSKEEAYVVPVFSVPVHLAKHVAMCSEVREALAPLKHKDVITTRSDVARTASEVRSEHKDVQSAIAKLQAYELS